jgi:metal-sulfur cluster biosynthetic enzyme
MSTELPTLPDVPHTCPTPDPSATAAAEGTPCAEKKDVANVPPPDETAMIDALKEVIDPELMINIVDLGLVYSITLDERLVHVEMTLTSPACPAGPQIVQQSKMAIERLPGIEKANIRLVMSPPWSPARMTDEARDILGIF